MKGVHRIEKCLWGLDIGLPNIQMIDLVPFCLRRQCVGVKFPHWGKLAPLYLTGEFHGNPVEPDLGHKGFVVIRTLLPDQVIGQDLIGLALNQLLQGRLIVPAALLHRFFPLGLQQHPMDESRSLSNAAVQINRREHRLSGVRQNRRPFPSAAGLLAPAQFQEPAQVQLFRHLVQTLLAHQRRPDTGQIPLRQIRVLSKQELRRHKAQNGIPQELQPLVAVQMLCAVFVGIGTVAHDLHGHAVIDGIGHLAGQKPAPDQAVQAVLLAAQRFFHLLRRQIDAAGADGLMMRSTYRWR